jgi:protein disulfide-isomerase A6
MGAGHGHGGGGGGGGGGLYDGDANVISLDESSFLTKSDGWVWLVEFYAPWCAAVWCVACDISCGMTRCGRV